MTAPRSGPPRGASSVALARLLAGPETADGIADALDWTAAQVRRQTATLHQATGARSRAELVADYAWAGHLAPEHLGARDLTAVHALPAGTRLLLRLTAAGMDDRAAGGEIGASAETVRRRREGLREALGVDSDHQAVGLGCLAGIVRRCDMPGRRPPRPAVPVPEHLCAPAARAQRHLAADGRALVVVPRREQARLAAAAAALAGGRRRALVLTAPGEYWEHDLAALADAHHDIGQVVAVLDRSEAARLPLAPDVAAATSPRAVRAAAGTTLPAVLVTTPNGLPVLDRLHRDGWPPPPDLAIALDAHLPALGERIGHCRGGPAPAAVLRLTSAPRFTAAGRAYRGGCDPATTGPLTAVLPLRRAVEAGLMRGYRLAAVCTTSSASHMGPARLVADLIAAHGLRRVIVRSTGPTPSLRLAEALGTAGLAAEALPARDRAGALARFTAPGPETRVLVCDGALPPGLGADALVHTGATAPTAYTAAAVEAALTPGTLGEGPLLVVSADRAEDSGWPVLAALTAALAALDPHLAADLAEARARWSGHDGLEFALPLPVGADGQRARRVCAWADTTWDEEMRTVAARAIADDLPRRRVLSPSGRPLAAWTLPARRTPAGAPPASNRTHGRSAGVGPWPPYPPRPAERPAAHVSLSTWSRPA
ncbi:hypothetical protein ACFRMQ_00360 [Kitasatospora sp. NPDC056783]|uniref:hypothetical protein n=1 Tax=Kitasatospora sp. NPDC056783 TaxID=3345943 RepID=UPI0036ADFE02